MNINYDNNNMVELSGKIVEPLKFSHSVLGEGFFESKLEVKRLSNECDILPITISERIGGGLKVGDYVSLKGQFRSYNKQETEKSRLILTVFVRELNRQNLAQFENIIKLVGYIC